MKKTNYDYLFKIVIVGNSFVGKSSLLLRFTDDKFDENFLSTIGVDFKFKTITVKDKKIKLQIWDTAGTEKFRTITSAYYKGADAIIICFDYTDMDSFKSLNSWMEEVTKQAHPDAIKILVGTKFDVEPKAVMSSDIVGFTQKRQMKMFDTSAKTNYQINDGFVYISERLLEIRVTKEKMPILVPEVASSKSKFTLGTEIVRNKASQLKEKCC